MLADDVHFDLVCPHLVECKRVGGVVCVRGLSGREVEKNSFPEAAADCQKRSIPRGRGALVLFSLFLYALSAMPRARGAGSGLWRSKRRAARGSDEDEADNHFPHAPIMRRYLSPRLVTPRR